MDVKLCSLKISSMNDIIEFYFFLQLKLILARIIMVVVVRRPYYLSLKSLSRARI